MHARWQSALRTLTTLRWQPSPDLAAVAVSCLLVTAALSSATFLATPARGGGLPYFFLYGLLTATLLGVGLPVAWTVCYRRRPVSDLGITTRWLGVSLALQVVFAAFEYAGGLARQALPPVEALLPLIALALAIGFFEALFWRGWVLQRLEASFGFVPAALLGSALYAVYHVGYGMPASEMVFLFFIGLMYALVFRLTGSIFILWPFFQPIGQLITLLKDQLSLPLLATVGFGEVLIGMAVLVFFAQRAYRRRAGHPPAPAAAGALRS